jgi:integrase
MPKLKLTDAAIAKLLAPDPSGNQRLHWDTELPGFGVLASGKTAAKTYIVQRDLPGGKTRRITIGPTAVLSPPQARERAKAVLAELLGGVDPKARAKSNVTLAATLEAYLEARKALRPTSRRNYRVYIERYLQPWLERPLRSITPEEVESRHRVIQQDIKTEGRYGGKAAANLALKTLAVLWNWAADRDPTLGPNPVGRLKRAWFPVHRRTRYVSAEQLPAFYKAVMELPNPIHRDYILLLLFTGMRRGEAASLTWNDIDLREQVIRVPATRTKSGQRLDLPMSDLVRDVILERQRLGRDSSGYLFPASGAAGHVTDVQHSLLQVAVSTGIKVSAHDLRRTFITVAESTDISPIALKALVNHTLGSDITGGYVVMTAERLREPAQKVADRMRGLMKIELPSGVAKISA